MPAGILCLAISLAMKPHDAGLVWFYFLLVGAPYRKRALQTFLITAVLGLCAFLWVSHVAPNWMANWQTNMAAISAHGGLNDPSLTSVTGRTGGMVIDMQSVLSVFRNEPRFYNPVSYLVCGALLLVWSVCIIRERFSPQKAWIALASVVPLTMLVTYHRPWDAKLLMLTVPACAMLWAKGGKIGSIAFLLTGAGIVMTADLPLTIFTLLTNPIQIPITGLAGQVLTAVLMRPVPLILLAMSIFYLWMYMRRDPERACP